MAWTFPDRKRNFFCSNSIDPTSFNRFSQVKTFSFTCILCNASKFQVIHVKIHLCLLPIIDVCLRLASVLLVTNAVLIDILIKETTKHPIHLDACLPVELPRRRHFINRAWAGIYLIKNIYKAFQFQTHFLLMNNGQCQASPNNHNSFQGVSFWCSHGVLLPTSCAAESH